MKDSSARQGTLRLTAEEVQKVVLLKETVENQICWDGERPNTRHEAVIGALRVAFFMKADHEGEFGQFQLDISRTEGSPALDEVQAMAHLFFGDKPFQIMPDEYNPARVRVMGLFFPYPT